MNRSQHSRQRILLYLILLLGVLGLMWWLVNMNPPNSDTQSVERDYPEVRKSGVLRVLTQYNTQDYYIQGDSTLGFVYDVVRMIGEDIGLRTEIILGTNWAEGLEKLRIGAVDLLAEAVPQTADTDALQFQFLEPISQGRIYLVRRVDDQAAGQRQLLLRGDTIHLPAAVPTKLFIAHLSEEIGDSIHIVFDPLYSAEQLAMKVASGDIRYTICSEHECHRLKTLLPNLDSSMPLSFGLFHAWLTRRNAPALADTVNASIRRLRDRGVLDKLYEKYGL